MNFSLPNNKYFKSFFLFIFITFFLVEFAFLVKSTYVALAVFHELHFSYNELRQDIKGPAIGLQAKTLLPEKATVTISPLFPELQEIGIRYQLFPFHTQDNGDFYIAAHKKESVPGHYTRSKDLPWGSRLFGQETIPFAPRHKPMASLSVGSTFLFTVLWSLFQILIGTLLLRLLSIDPGKDSKIGFWSTGYLLGYLALTVSLWIFLLLGGTLSKMSLTVFWGTGLFILLCFYLKKYPLKYPISSDKPTLHKFYISSLIDLFFKNLSFLSILMIFIVIAARPVLD